MKKNIGITDKIIRFVVIDLLLGFSYLGKDIPDSLAFVSFIIVILLVISMFTSYSVIYHLLNISTREKSGTKTET